MWGDLIISCLYPQHFSAFLYSNSVLSTFLYYQLFFTINFSVLSTLFRLTNIPLKAQVDQNLQTLTRVDKGKEKLKRL